MKFVPLLQWMLIWAMASANEADWAIQERSGLIVDKNQDRVSRSADGWLDLTLARAEKVVSATEHIYGTPDELFWLEHQFMKKTTRTIQRHTLVTYMKMLETIPGGTDCLVRIVQEKPYVQAYGNAVWGLVLPFLNRLSAVKVGKLSYSVMVGPWKMPKLKELTAG